jgi:hypothetical protein
LDGSETNINLCNENKFECFTQVLGMVYRLKFSKKIQNNIILRYSMIGALVGSSVGMFNVSFLCDHDGSDAFFYLLIGYCPSFGVSSPWSLLSIFVEGFGNKIIIISIGAILNGLILGAAYGALNKDK